jgi:membrane protein involved in D-alanine export
LTKGRDTSKISLLEFFNFTAFVPTLLIGPLDRFDRFKKDTKNGYENMTIKKGNQALNNFILGLLFKFIIAEAIRRLILAHLIDDGSLTYHFSYMYTYLFYLFFDFAGYSLLAISFGIFIGIDVPVNFDKPFNVVNPKEFWKKWHKSLGDWLNDYFFKPIFKYFTTKKIGTSIQRQNAALFLTFTLMGF